MAVLHHLSTILLSLSLPLTYAFIPGSVSQRYDIKTSADSLIRLKAAVDSPTVDATNTEDVIDGRSSTNESIFETLVHLSFTTLYQSDLKRDAKGTKKTTGSSATNWIDDKSSYALKSLLDKITITLPSQITGLDRDEAIAWIRWMKSSPVPLIVDLTQDLIAYGGDGGTISDEQLAQIDTTRKDFQSRISCKLILLPSGAELEHPLVEPTGGILFGKLLYGGVSRYRLLGSSTSNRPPRRVGEHTTVKTSAEDNIPSWIQFGGAERKYQAVDMGSSAVLELTLLPKGKKAGTLFDAETPASKGEMGLNRLSWETTKMFDYSHLEKDEVVGVMKGDQSHLLTGNSAMNLGGKQRNEAFTNDFENAVGGLSSQIEVIVRRVLDGRVIRPVEEDSGGSDSDDLISQTDGQLSQAALDADELATLGLSPVRGLLLYGPPGCGKTALVREISRALRARSPKIVAAPELLDRWVGSSEKLIRSLFADAEAELASCNGDATKSALHVIVIDEIDAVFRKRSSAEDSGEATRSSAVNQILSKLDGVNAIPNVLMIGMTNRRELLDPALLRPGRLEVQILVPLPDTEGRREILNIHFDALRKKGRLSKPLCCAIDGIRYDVDAVEEEASQVLKKEGIESTRKRDKAKRLIKQIVPSLPGRNFDLAEATKGYSGADIAGLVRCSGSIALSRTRQSGSGIDELLITLDDVKEALEEVSL